MSSQSTPTDHNYAAVMDAVNGAVSPFYVFGDIPLGNDNLILHFSSNEEGTNSKAIRFPLASPEAVTPLIEACKQASFGVGQESVLDPEYRRALVLQGRQFAVAPVTSIDPSALGILANVRRALLGDPTAHISAHLDKLNVYGVGDFFKQHVDTPRSNRMFGTLLINLPVEHKGGNLVVYAPNKSSDGRQENKQTSADASVKGHPKSYTTNWGDTNTVGWVAFFSDCPHEVLPVTQGNSQVTLTFNLFSEGEDGDNGAVPSDSARHFTEPAVDGLVEALSLPGQFDESRPRLCFHLQHRYPVDLNKDRADTARQILKGGDAVIYRALQKLGATLSFHFVTKETGYYAKHSKYRGHYVLEESARVKLDRAYTFLISEVFSGVPLGDLQAFTLAALPQEGPGSPATGSKFTYMAYGNEPRTCTQYASICMIACILGRDIREVWPKSDYNPRSDYI